MTDQSFRRLSSRAIYDDQLLSFRRDTVRSPDGEEMHRTVIEYHPSCAVVPCMPGGKILLIKHFRYPINAACWEIPGGFIEVGETQAQCAQRELREETGCEALQLTPLMDFNGEPAFTSHQVSLFAATGIRRIPRVRVQEAEIREIGVFDTSDIAGMLREGAIRTSWTIIGLLIVGNSMPGYEGLVLPVDRKSE